MKEEKMKKIISFSLIIIYSIIFWFLTAVIIYAMVSSLCDKSEIVYFRYQQTGGLFSHLEKVQTTKYKSDGTMKICLQQHKANFLELNRNIEYIVNKTRSS